MPEGIDTLIDQAYRARKKILKTFFAEFSYLLALNEVLLQHFR